MENISEKMLKTFYQCFIATFIVSFLMADDFGISTLKAITVSCFASSLSAAMNYGLRYIEEKESVKHEKQVFESDDDKNNQNYVGDGLSNDWDKYIHRGD